MPNAPLILPVLLCALILAVSGIAKLRAPVAAADAFTSLRIPAPAWAPRALPIGELVLAVALLVLPAPLLAIAAVATTVLMLAYTVVIARALRFAEPVRCNCFGELGSHDVSVRTLVRNLLLVVAAALTIWASAAGVSVPQALSEAAQNVLAWVALAALACAVVLLSFGSASEDETAPAFDGDEDLEGEGEYHRLPIPLGQARDGLGDIVTLEELTRGTAVLLIWVSPGCGPCQRVITQIPGWAEELSPAVSIRALYSTEREVVEQMAPQTLDLALYDVQNNVSRVLRMPSYPSAVLLGADGYLAGGPVRGEQGVEEFLADVRAELLEAGALPDHPAAQQDSAVAVGSEPGHGHGQ
ncbi:TlpA family protein disulfide reductase [Dermacoccaceae bacterium W4C1]